MEWLKASGIRAIKTIAQTAIASIGTAMVLTDVDWIYVLSASLLAGLLSILMSVAGLPEVGETVKTIERAEELEDEGDEQNA